MLKFAKPRMARVLGPMGRPNDRSTAITGLHLGLLAHQAQCSSGRGTLRRTVTLPVRSAAPAPSFGPAPSSAPEPCWRQTRRRHKTLS